MPRKNKAFAQPVTEMTKVTEGENLSFLSLKDRAEASVIAELLGGDRSDLLGAVAPREGRGHVLRKADVPSMWTQVHVLDRLEEAMGTLVNLRMTTRPKSYGNAMPEVVRQKLSILDQIEMAAGALDDFTEDRNRVRLTVTAAQISRMDQAFGWITDYLDRYPEIARALNLRALWGMQGIDIGRRCRSRGMNAVWFNRRWQHGLAIVTLQLLRARVPVS